MMGGVGKGGKGRKYGDVFFDLNAAHLEWLMVLQSLLG